MLLCEIEEELDALDNRYPPGSNPPPEIVEDVLALLAGALGLEAEEGFEADITVPGESGEGEGFREMGAKLPPMSD